MKITKKNRDPFDLESVYERNYHAFNNICAMTPNLITVLLKKKYFKYFRNHTSVSLRTYSRWILNLILVDKKTLNVKYKKNKIKLPLNDTDL